jgi:hypothetical protein
LARGAECVASQCWGEVCLGRALRRRRRESNSRTKCSTRSAERWSVKKEARIEFAEQQHAGVGRDGATGKLGDDRARGETLNGEGLPLTLWDNQERSSSCKMGLFTNTLVA